MGQKTNPIGIRIGINKTWDSTWFDEKNYASKLHEDILIREFLNKKLFFLKILDDFFMSEKKLTSPLVLIIILQLGIGLKGLSLPLIFKSHATFSGADIKI